MSEKERDANAAVDAPAARAEAAEARTASAVGAAGALRETVGELTGQLAQTSTQLAVTASQLQVTQKMVRTQRQVLIVVIVLILLIIASGAYFGPKILSTTSAVRSTQVVNRNTNQQIADCLVPTGKCFRMQQENQSKIISAITDANHNGVPDTQEILQAVRGR